MLLSPQCGKRFAPRQAAEATASGLAPPPSSPPMLSPFEPLALGLGFGTAAGLSPGPLMTLVVATALDRGAAAGARVAMAPLITDAPVIVLAVWISSALPAGWLAALGVAGGCFALWLGADIWRRAGDDLPSGAGDAAPRDLLRGAFVNLLSPHPWLFWMTIGAPILIEAVRRQSLLGLSFLGGFYLCLVGLLALIAWLVARAGRRLGGVTTRRIVRACALLLVALGAWLIWHHGGRVLGERGEVPKAISPADVAWNEEAGHDE